MKTTDEVVHEVRLAGQVGEYGQAIRELAEERDNLRREVARLSAPQGPTPQRTAGAVSPGSGDRGPSVIPDGFALGEGWHLSVAGVLCNITVGPKCWPSPGVFAHDKAEAWSCRGHAEIAGALVPVEVPAAPAYVAEGPEGIE